MIECNFNTDVIYEINMLPPKPLVRFLSLSILSLTHTHIFHAFEICLPLTLLHHENVSPTSLGFSLSVNTVMGFRKHQVAEAH